MLTVRLDSPESLTDQIVDGIRSAIARGELRAGRPLPTVRQLAADLGINLNTVARAYRALESQGLVSTTRGRGTVVRAEREATSASPESIGRRLQSALADARLAGLGRGEVERMFRDQIARLWHEEEGR